MAGVLMLYNRGEDVKRLQIGLNKHGYNLQVDGIFGQATEKAVKDFQKKHGLVVDGVVGAKTWKALGTAEPKCVDSSVVYEPLSSCITHSANRQIKYLIIHYTAGTSSASGKAKALRNMWQKKGDASADFGVDDTTMVQFNPDLHNTYCWAVSGGNGITNHNSISIEICSNLKKGTSASVPNHDGWYFTEASLDNAVRLAKLLMAKFNIPIERVVRHYDVTGKLCPGIIGWNNGYIYTEQGKRTNKKNNSSKWEAFKERLI